MTTDAALNEKREELKRRLAAGEYRTLIDVVLDGTGRIIRKIARSSRPISPWYSSLILFLVILLMGFGLIILFGDVSNIMRQPAIWPGVFILFAILVGYSSVASVVASNIYVHRVFTTFHDSVLDAAESSATVDDFEHWLTAVCNRKAHLFVSMVVGVLVAIYIHSVLPVATGLFVPFGVVVAYLLFGTFGGAFIYSIFQMVALSARVGRYHLKLYSADPGSSEVISHLSGVLGRFMYGIAIYVAIATLVTAAFGLLDLAGGFFVLFFWWIPIVAMFILNQSSLSSIIRRAKWKTLNEIQARVEQLHAADSLAEKDTMDAISRLMDYHDRIKGTRSSAIDLRAVLSLINSLLLPFLALLLANLDKVLALFQ